jgi:enoyl-CoA hydratase
MTDAVLYESRGAIAIITINRPEKRNALNPAVVDGLAAAWQRLQAGPDRVGVLTAAGDKAFSVGADLKEIPQDLWRGIPGIGVEVDKPIVGAVAGWVVGGGLVLAQACDLLVAADDTRFLYPEAKIGFSGGLISALVSRIPHKVAMEVLLLGETFTAERAHQVGFVNKIVPAGQQLAGALDYAEKLAANAPLVLALLKRFAAEILPRGPSERAAIARAAVDRVTGSADLKEGIAAFAEKRAPNFAGY